MFESVDPRPYRGTKVWTAPKLKPGGRWHGWRAGPTVGVYCHHLGGTQACREVMTRGELKCGLCAQIRALEGEEAVTTRWKGYIPMFDEAGVESVAIICDTYRAQAETVPLHGYAVLTKTLTRGCALRLDPLPAKPLPVTLSEQQRRPQDIRAWMLRVWRDPELVAWCMKHVSTPAVAQVEKEAKPEKKAPAKRGPLAAHFDERLRDRLKLPPGDGPVTIGELIEHTANGKPRKPR